MDGRGAAAPVWAPPEIRCAPKVKILFRSSPSLQPRLCAEKVGVPPISSQRFVHETRESLRTCASKVLVKPFYADLKTGNAAGHTVSWRESGPETGAGNRGRERGLRYQGREREKSDLAFLLLA